MEHNENLAIRLFCSHLRSISNLANVSIVRLNTLLRDASNDPSWPDRAVRLEIVDALSSFLSRCGQMSLVFWPHRRKDPEQRAVAYKRAELLRELLAVDDTSSLKRPVVRNKLLHADELMDDWIANWKGKRMRRELIVPTGYRVPLSDEAYEVFDYQTGTYTFAGYSCSIHDLNEERVRVTKNAIDVQQKLQKEEGSNYTRP